MRSNHTGIAHVAPPPPGEPDGGTWKNSAECRDIYQFTEQTIPQQLAVCRGGNGWPICPVIAQCLELGLQQPLHIAGRIDFVFGATHPRELKRMHERRRQLARAGAA